jgi:MoxR-like ATPase
MLITAKTRALISGRFAISREDLEWSARPSLRHRIILNFEGEAEGISTDALLDRILARLAESKARG